MPQFLTSCLPSPVFFRVVGFPRSSPGKSDIGDVDANERTLHRRRKVGCHGRPIGSCTAALNGDDGDGSGCSASDCPETGNISVTYGLDDEKIRIPTGRECSPHVGRFPRNIDSVPGSPRAAKVGPTTLGRSGGSEPLGSPVAGHGAGNQQHVETEDGNVEEDEKGNQRQTRSNIANSSMNHDTSDGGESGSNLRSVGSRHQSEGKLSGLQFRLRAVFGR